MKKLNDNVTLIKTHGYAYYAKWFSTIIIIIAVMCRSVDEIPKIYDQSLSLVGTLGWLYVSLCWKDRALIILNSVLVFVLSAGVLRWIFTLS